MKIKIGPYPKHRWYHNFLYEKFGISNEPKVSVHSELEYRNDNAK